MIRIQIFLFFLLSFFQLHSQSKLDTPLRGEIPAKDIDYVSFIPIGERGLIVFGHTEDQKNKKDVWKIERFDKNFNLVWQEEFLCQKNQQLVEYQFANDSILVAFFSFPNTSVSGFSKISLNIINGKHTEFDYRADKKVFVEHYNVLNNKVFVSGTLQPNALAYLGQFFFTFTIYPIFTGDKVYSIKPIIKFLDKDQQIHKTFSPDIKGFSEVICAQTDTLRDVYACIVRNQHRSKSKLFYLEFDEYGELILMNEMSQANSKNIISGSLIFSNNGDLLFAGTYNDAQGFQRNRSSISDGMFFGKIEGGDSKNLKFYKFSDFKNTFGTLSFKEMKRMTQRQQKNKEFNISFNLLMHNEITYFDSNYILIAENYYPEYHYEIAYDARGYAYQQEVFDGFRYTHAIAAAFDTSGNLVWDNLIEIGDILSMRLQENVLIFQSGEEQALVYYSEGTLNSKIISGNKVVSKKVSDEIPTVRKDEKVIYEDYGQIYHWYKDFFLITSYQKVMSLDGDKRKVYNFNKLIFQ